MISLLMTARHLLSVTRVALQSQLCCRINFALYLCRGGVDLEIPYVQYFYENFTETGMYITVNHSVDKVALALTSM